MPLDKVVSSTNMAASEPVVEQVRLFMMKALRAEYSYLKRNALEDLAERCKKMVSDLIIIE